MKKVLVTGGAGYIGSILVRKLLAKGYQVKVLDSLLFGGESILNLLDNPNFVFIKGDIREEDSLDEALEGVEYVAHLAAIVGDPACAKDPDVTNSVNMDGAKLLYQKALEKGVKKFVFASTCSNYGKMDDPDAILNETSKLAPVSLYAETKVAFEDFLLSQNVNNECKPTVLRFSTVYGMSPRPRFDLTVNEFTKDLAEGKKLVIFGEQFWRPYCHVDDLANSVVLVFESEAEKVNFEVFNVGNNDENYTKKMLAEELMKIYPEAEIEYVKKVEDPRDYRVNFDKITNQLGFEITKTVPQGMRKIANVIGQGFFTNPDDIRFRNS